MKKITKNDLLDTQGRCEEWQLPIMRGLPCTQIYQLECGCLGLTHQVHTEKRGEYTEKCCCGGESISFHTADEETFILSPYCRQHAADGGLIIEKTLKRVPSEFTDWSQKK